MQIVVRADDVRMVDFGEVVIVGGNPEQRRNRYAKCFLDDGGHFDGGQRLVNRKQRTAEQACLLSGRYEEAITCGNALQLCARGIGRSTNGGLHRAQRRMVELCAYRSRHPPNRIRVPWRALEERRESRCCIVVVADQIGTRDAVDAQLHVELLGSNRRQRCAHRRALW